MKKTIVLIISCIFLISNSVQASLFSPNFNPYSFGPQGRTMADLRDFAKPKQMVDILSGRPVAATKADGTRVYYSPKGSVSLSVKPSGEMTFSLTGFSKNTDKFGNETSTTITLEGNWQEVRNKDGERTGYNQLNGNGKVIESYDKNRYLTTTFHYNGEHLEYSINKMNGQKTVYDEYDRVMAIYTAEGRILKTYQYTDVSYDTDENCLELFIIKKDINREKIRLETTKDYKYVGDVIAGNDNEELESGISGHFEAETTFYNDRESIDYIVNALGETIYEYNYDKDTSGNIVLSSVYDCKNQERTFYENGKQQYTVNSKGGRIREYYYNGSEFSFSVELGNNNVWKTTANSDGIVAYADGNDDSDVAYNDDGQINRVSDKNGNVIERYFYIENSNGEKILDYVENVQDGTKTYYEYDYDTGKFLATQTLDSKGNILIDYGYNGSQKIYEFNRETGITTWYSDNGEVKYNSLDSQLISKDIFSAGQLIAKWNARAGTLTIFVNQEEKVTLEQFYNEPDVNDVRIILYDYMRNTPSNY